MAKKPKPKPDKTIELMDAAMQVVEAVLDYEAARRDRNAEACKRIREFMFNGAHRLMDMRLKNLQDALSEIGDSPDYQDWLRRN